MDPLSDVLSLLKLCSYSASGFDAGGAWSLQFPSHQGFKCYVLRSGHCWLAVDGIADTIKIETGDFLMLSSGRSFRLASNLELTPVCAHSAAFQPGLVLSWNGGGDCFGFGGHWSARPDLYQL